MLSTQYIHTQKEFEKNVITHVMLLRAPYSHLSNLIFSQFMVRPLYHQMISLGFIQLESPPFCCFWTGT